MYYSQRLGDLEPTFDSCPSVCAATDKAEPSYCETCPRREMDEDFREETTFYLNERCGDQWKKYGFDLLMQNVLTTMELDREPDADLTTTAARLKAILNGERDRKRRIEEWNSSQAKRRTAANS